MFLKFFFGKFNPILIIFRFYFNLFSFFFPISFQFHYSFITISISNSNRGISHFLISKSLTGFCVPLLIEVIKRLEIRMNYEGFEEMKRQKLAFRYRLILFFLLFSFNRRWWNRRVQIYIYIYEKTYKYSMFFHICTFFSSTSVIIIIQNIFY